jgi:hypothetical protein
VLPEILIARGAADRAVEFVPAGERLRANADVQTHATGANILAIAAEARGDRRAALEFATEAVEFGWEMGSDGPDVKVGVVRGVESALELGDLDAARGLLGRLDALRPGELAPYLDAQRTRLRARLSAVEGGDGVEAGFKLSAGSFRELGTPFWLGVTLCEYGEWLIAVDRRPEAAPHLEEAHDIFERLQARPWSDRVKAALGVRDAANA